jgi:flagellar biogenesis protein FliO
MRAEVARAVRVAALAVVAIALTAGSARAADPPAANAPAANTPATNAPAADPRPWLAHSGAPASAGGGEPARTPWRGILVTLAAVGVGALAWYAKKSGRLSRAAPQGARLRMLSSVRVGPKSHVALIAVGGRGLLVGASDASVRRLGWIDLDADKQAEDGEDPPRFDRMLDRLAAPAEQRALAADTHRGDSSAAAALAKEQRDVVEISGRQGGRAAAKDAAATDPARALDLEEQVTGLLKRTGRRPR